MAILVGSGKRLTTDDGIPYMWQSGDATTAPNEVGIMTASDGAASDYFGYSVAVGSARIVVSARESNSNQGAAYIYNLDGTNEVKITASDGAANDYFGQSVAVGCGKVVVGSEGFSSNQGAVYIYDLDGTNEVKITASDGAANDRFGHSVAVGCGKIVVGAYADDDNGGSSGSAYIYDLDGTNEIKITASDADAFDLFGNSVAVGCGRIVVGCYWDTDNGSNSGSAYIYDLDGNNEIKITASDGAANDYFGQSVAIGSGRIVVGVKDVDIGSNSDQGAVYIYDLDGTNEIKITASDGALNDEFGNSVAVGCGRIVVGSYFDDDNGSNSGSVYIFDLDGNQLTKITASDSASTDEFGYSVAVGCGRIVVGAHQDDVNSNTDQGSAYIYDTPLVYNLYDAIDLNYG